MKLKLLGLCSVILFLSFGKVLADPIVPSYNSNQINLFNKIGWCESRGDLHAKNPRSSASGEYQWINSSWYHYGKELWGEDFYSKNIWTEDNRELAWYVFTTYGANDWLASKFCWSPMVET